jgi:hypothetical protein
MNRTVSRKSLFELSLQKNLPRLIRETFAQKARRFHSALKSWLSWVASTAHSNGSNSRLSVEAAVL